MTPTKLESLWLLSCQNYLALHVQLTSQGRGGSIYLEEIILMDHAAVGERLDEPVGQGGFTTIGDPAGIEERQRRKNRIRIGSESLWDTAERAEA